ncbi:MAG TPA: diaminopimelate epimerase [Gemmatimonadaceae bacterium]
MDGVEASMVGNPGPRLIIRGRPFFKMSGSGNDFVFFDVSSEGPGNLESAEAIQRICARGTGIGADGVVFLKPDSRRELTIRYYNSDGSLGELCGNATLCSLQLANELGMADTGEIEINTDAGVIHARMADGLPEIDLAPVHEVALSVAAIPQLDREESMGFARAGVPHIVIVDQDVETADILGRGSEIRRHRSLKDGANVNFVTKSEDGWTIRTYERGVEGETLACGTGAVATGILLTEWGRAEAPVRLQTRSGRTLEVRVRRDGNLWYPSLRGHAEVVFEGRLAANLS